MRRFHTIVVAVDFSDTSRDTLEAAVGLARGEDHHLHLVHVVQDAFRSPAMVEMPTLDWAAVQRGWIDDAREKLVQLASTLSLDPQRVTIDVSVGHPGAEIVRYAHEHGADALVLGSHGHGLIRRFVLGSVADRVLRLATCPVVLVPHRTLRTPSADVEAAAGVES